MSKEAEQNWSNGYLKLVVWSNHGCQLYHLTLWVEAAEIVCLTILPMNWKEVTDNGPCCIVMHKVCSILSSNVVQHIFLSLEMVCVQLLALHSEFQFYLSEGSILLLHSWFSGVSWFFSLSKLRKLLLQLYSNTQQLGNLALPCEWIMLPWNQFLL